MKISVCIPMYNEKKICVDAAQTLCTAMTEFCKKHNYDYEILFCDDGSTDGCADVLRDAVRQDPALSNVQVLGYEKNRGKGAAVRTAALASTGDVVVYTDCDLAYGTDVIGQAVEFLREKGSDGVLGSRNLSADGYAGYTFLRRIASKLYIRVIAFVAGFNLTDSQCGFKCFRGDAARKIFSLCTIDGFSFDLEVIKIAQMLKYTLAEMPVRIINHRESKIHLVQDSLRMLNDLRKIKKHVRELKKNNKD